jgi:hypothetical protein
VGRPAALARGGGRRLTALSARGFSREPGTANAALPNTMANNALWPPPPFPSGQSCRDRVARRGRGRPLVLAVFWLSATLARASEARACAYYTVGPSSARPLPVTGATAVPTGTSFVVAIGRMPTQLSLEANGTAIPFDEPTLLGTGSGPADSFDFWQIKPTGGRLPPSSIVTLSGFDVSLGQPFTSTITTADGTDTAAGAPAHLSGLTLRLFHFQPNEIGGDSCVRSADVSWVELKLDGAQVPGTAPVAVINSVTLMPKAGGAAQSHMFLGQEMYPGETPAPNGPRAPPGWSPNLDPSVEYCATVTSFGTGDLSRAPLVSNTLCTSVESVGTPGAPAGSGSSGGVNGATGGAGGQQAGAGGAGGQQAGAGGARLAGHDDVAGSGCSVAGGGAPASVLVALALLVLGARRPGRKRASCR